MKKCPFCAEMIQGEATVCRYCGRDLPSSVRKSNQELEIAVGSLSEQESNTSVERPKPLFQSAQIFSLSLLTVIAIVVWVIAMNPQSSSSNKLSPMFTAKPVFTPKPTFTPKAVFTQKPDSAPFVMPKGDFIMSWDLYNSQYNSFGGILTIRRQGHTYTETLVMNDGSSAVFVLTIISEGSEIKLSGHLGNPYSLYPHDYIQIESNGWLGFYDDQGYIYGVPPIP